MTDKSVLVLCAGEQDRWGDDNLPKQLLYAGTESILDRITRQVRERGLDPIIVTHKSILMRQGVMCVVPHKREWKVESLLDIQPTWGKKSTLVLLGDVIYQWHVMNRILDHDGIDMFFGNYAEIFAFYFVRHDQVYDYLTKTLYRCIKHGDKGTLHSLFNAYIGRFDDHQIEHKKDASLNFTHVTGDGGWTRDIDDPEEYELFLEQVVQSGKLDDLP